MKEQLLANLDSEQQAACSSPFKPTLVKAVAGSGKTRTLTHRVAYTIASGVPASEIMLLTFTNKASKEMLGRIKSLLNDNSMSVEGGTFHSVGSKYIRKHAHRIGYTVSYSIIDVDEAQNLIKKRLNRYLIDNQIETREFPNKKIIYSLYSKSINTNVPFDEVASAFSLEEVDAMKGIIELYKEDKLAMNLMDFDDLIVNFLKILEIDAVRESISKQFKYIFCDEYQDINHIQHKILKLLNQGNDNIYVVGDPNQSIYGWRGGNIDFIENFHKDFSGSQEYKITYNYRSYAPILSLAEKSINNNYDEDAVRITPYLEGGNLPFYSEFSEYDQVKFIVKKIKEYRLSEIPYNEMSILLRTNFLANMFERELRFNNIPYQLIAGFSFFDRAHVKDILSFLKIVNNPTDIPAYTRALSLFDGVGEKSAEKTIEHLESYMYSIESLKMVKLSKKAKLGVDQFVELMDKIKKQDSIVTQIACILDEFYDDKLRLTHEDYPERLEDVTFMLEMSKRYSELNDFLEDMILSVESEDVNGEDGIILTTYHKSKGLEWDVVFMPYIGTLPYGKADVSEERRLFYVGVTRAKKQLYVTHVSKMPFSGDHIPESQFITEIEEHDCFLFEEEGA